MTTAQLQPPAPVAGPRARSDVMTLLAELGRVLKGRSFYGPGDPSLGRIFERTLRVWQLELERNGPVEITVTAEGIAVPELGAAGSLAGQFSSLNRAFSVRGVQRLRAEPGLDAEAFAAVVEILVTDPARLDAEGGVGRALAMRAPFAVAINADPAEALAAEASSAPEPAAQVAAPVEPDLLPATDTVASAPVVAQEPVLPEPVAAPAPLPEPTPVVTAPPPLPEPTPVVAAPPPLPEPTPVVTAPAPLPEPPPVVAAPPPLPEPTPVVAAPAPLPEPPSVVAAPPPLPEPPSVVTAPPPLPEPPSVVTAPPAPRERVHAPLLPEDESPAPAMDLPETSFQLPGEELLLAPLDGPAADPLAASPVDAVDDMLFAGSQAGSLDSAASAEDAGSETDGIDDAPTLVEGLSAAPALPDTGATGNEDLTTFSSAEPLELDDPVAPRVDTPTDLAPSFDDDSDLELGDEAGFLDADLADEAADDLDEPEPSDTVDGDEAVTWFADAVASTPDFTGPDADDDAQSLGGDDVTEDSGGGNAFEPPDEEETPGVPSHYVQEILAELDASRDAMQYQELADRAVNASEVLCEQGLTDESFPILAAFARHAGDDEKRDLQQQETARQQMLRLALGSCRDDLLDRACGDDPTSLQAIQILTSLGGDVAALVLRATENERSASRRERLHGVLIAIGDDALPELARAMKDDAPARVRTAIRLAGELQNPALVPQLAERLANANATVSQEAAKALARLGDETAIDALAVGLREGSEHVPTNAANALASTSSPGAVEPLLGAMRASIDRGDTEFARDVIRALGRLGQAGATTELAALLLRSGMFQRRRHRELKLAAASALGRLPGDEAVGALAQAARSRDAHIRRAAQIALDRRSQALTGS